MDWIPTSSQSPVNCSPVSGNPPAHRHTLHDSARPLLATLISTVMIAFVVIVVAAMHAGGGTQFLVA